MEELSIVTGMKSIIRSDYNNEKFNQIKFLSKFCIIFTRLHHLCYSLASLQPFYYPLFIKFTRLLFNFMS
jgi:hypothetical protein